MDRSYADWSGALAPTLHGVGIADPFPDRIAGLAGEDDRAGVGVDGERLVPRRVAWCRDHPDRGRDLVVAVDEEVRRPGCLDPLQDRVVGGVSNLPFGRLHVDARARNRAVLTGVVRVEVAVHDVRDLVLFDTGLAQDVEDRSADRRVHLVELRVAEAEPGVEQEHPVGMPDDTAHDDTTLGRPAADR